MYILACLFVPGHRIIASRLLGRGKECRSAMKDANSMTERTAGGRLYVARSSFIGVGVGVSWLNKSASPQFELFAVISTSHLRSFPPNQSIANSASPRSAVRRLGLD